MTSLAGIWMEYCSEYFIAQRVKGYPDETFYREYNFICYERFEKTDSKQSSQADSLQTDMFLQGNELT